jgi:hypothetical protein
MTHNAGPRMEEVKFSEVRQLVQLTWFFEYVLGAPPKQMNGTIRYHMCPNSQCGESSKHSVKVSVEENRWRCFACGERGDVIDAAATFWGVSPRDAALKLIGADPDVMKSYVPPKPKPVVPRDDTAIGVVVDALLAARRKPDDGMLAYLNGRGISMKLAMEAIRRGIMVTLPTNPNSAKELLYDLVGEAALIKAGMLREDAKAPAIAFRPLVFISKGSRTAEFRLSRPAKEDEVKSLRYGDVTPWAWQGADSSRVMITEGCIDLLSAVQMGTKRSIIGLPGCVNWQPEWFHKLKGRNVLVALDSDERGQSATAKLVPVLQAVGADVGVYGLPAGIGDLNEQLQAQLGLA